MQRARKTVAEGGPLWLGALRRAPLVLGAFAGLITCLLGAFLLTVLHRGEQPSPATPSSLAAGVCADLLHRQYTDLYLLLSPPQRAAGTETQFIASQRQLDIASGEVTECTAVASSGITRAAVTFTLRRKLAGALAGDGVLVVVGGVWRLDTYDGAVI